MINEDSKVPLVEVDGYEEPDHVKLSEEIFDDYYSTQSAWTTQATADTDFFNGNQWTDKAKKELKRLKQFPIVVNVIKPAVEQARAMLTTNKPKFSSTGREDGDVKTGKLFADIMAYIWDISKGNIELKQAITDYYVKGRGNGLLYFDPISAEIKWKSIDPRNVFPDPNSKDIYWEDAAHIVLADLVTMEQAEREYPGIDFKDAKHDERDFYGSTNYGLTDQSTIDSYTDMRHKRCLRLDRYTKERKATLIITGPTGRTDKVDEDEAQQILNQPVVVIQSAEGVEYKTSEEEVQRWQQMLQEFGNIFHFVQDPMTGQPVAVSGPETGAMGEMPNSTTQVQIVAYGSLSNIEKELSNRIYRCLSVGGVEIYSGFLPAKVTEYPVFVLPNHWSRNPYAMSDVRFVRPLQEFVNKIRSLIVAHTSNAVNNKWWVPRGGINKKEVEEGFAKAGTYIGEYDAEFGAPTQAGPSPLPNELYKNEADARKDIQEILGIYPLMQGDSGQAPVTYKGTIAIDEYGQRRLRSKKDDIEYSLNKFAMVMVQFIQSYYTYPKVMRLIQPDGRVNEVKINQGLADSYNPELVESFNDVTTGQYDVVVVSGSMLPSNRWAQFEYYMQMYQAGLIDQVEVLKKTEIVDTEGVLERFSQMNQMQAQIQQLTQQLEAISGDKQTTDRENLHLKQKVEVEKFKTKINQVSNRAEMSGQLFQQRMSDELKKTKEQERLLKQSKSKGTK